MTHGPATAARAVQRAHVIADRARSRTHRGSGRRLARRARPEPGAGTDPAAGDEAGHAASSQPPDELARFGLTAREREVLSLLAAGRSNPEIGHALFISTKTASVHLSNILAKLGVSGRVQAAAMVQRLGV